LARTLFAESPSYIEEASPVRYQKEIRQIKKQKPLSGAAFA
jgi:hypothetical protein